MDIYLIGDPLTLSTSGLPTAEMSIPDRSTGRLCWQVEDQKTEEDRRPKARKKKYRRSTNRRVDIM